MYSAVYKGKGFVVKKLWIFVFGFIFTVGAFATGIDSGATSADCDNATLGQYNGTANLEMDWQPNTINIRWYDGENQLSVQSAAQTCSYGGALYLPTAPTKKGYTFEGWELKHAIPGGYTELEYIQTNGDEYIDTGYAWTTQNRKVNMEFMITTYKRRSHLFGSTNYLDYDLNPYFSTNASYEQNYIGTERYFYLNQDFIQNTKYNVVWDLRSDKSFQMTVNNTNYGPATVDRIPTTGVSVYLFHVHRINPASFLEGYNPAIGRIYGTKMWDNENLVRNFIPAKRNSDNVVGMYDTVTQTFFTNAGSGTFTAGPEIQ